MRLTSFVTAASVAVMALVLAPEALAQRGRNQAASVVVIDYARIVAESVLGRDMATKLQQIRGQVSTEAQALAPEQQSIEQERQRLATATRNMSAEQIRNSSTFAPQFRALAERAQQFQSRGQALQGDLECSQAIALRDFNNLALPVVQNVMRSRGAGVVLSSDSVQYADPANDITTTVIQQLDQNPATRVATVARHAVAECLPQQAQQPAAAPAQ